MGKEVIFFGILGILSGVGIFLVGGSIIAALIPVVFGIVLIVFNRSEDEIEKVNEELENENNSNNS